MYKSRLGYSSRSKMIFVRKCSSIHIENRIARKNLFITHHFARWYCIRHRPLSYALNTVKSWILYLSKNRSAIFLDLLKLWWIVFRSLFSSRTLLTSVYTQILRLLMELPLDFLNIYSNVRSIWTCLHFRVFVSVFETDYRPSLPRSITRNISKRIFVWFRPIWLEINK